MGKNLKRKEIGKGIRQRKDGRYEARITIKGSGKPPFSIYGTNLQQVRKQRSMYLAEVLPGVPGFDSSMSVSKWYEKWMELYKVRNLKATTIRNYEDGFRRTEEYIGYMKLVDIKPEHILDMIKKLEDEGYAPTSIKQSLSVVHQMFERAAASRDRYEELFLILMHTGMRIGEVLALQWRDVNFDEKYLRVYKTLNRVKLYYDKQGKKLAEPYYVTQITSPKKKKSVRIIPLPDIAIEAFLSWKKKQNQDKKVLGKKWETGNDLLKKYPGLIFTTSTGMSYLPGNAEDECERIKNIVNKQEALEAEKEGREAEMLDVTPHSFRHTFVTRCVQSGMKPATVGKISGHSTQKMTEYYTHLEQGYVKDEYKRYDKKYGKES
nr:site-specific integrase [uncultured Blautia sp.]